ncbi:hypothetical protein [Salinicola rhizosphaerae]|nr:hypothetical protein [Salinicola rhizosphaerae]
MRLMKHEMSSDPLTRRNRRQPGSLASLADAAGMPVGTLKSRIRALVDKGVPREEAIQQALSQPLAPQGRPRQP